MTTIGNPWMWSGFLAFVLAMLALDLGVFQRRPHQPGFREAALWSAAWLLLALGFNGLLWVWFGPQKAMEFFTGYLLEKTLSLDNIFVFVLIFAAFRVPAAQQHRVLLWGILGALVLRALFVAAGASLLARFHGVIYLFGAFLLFTGLKLLLARGPRPDPQANPALRLFRRLVPAVEECAGSDFTVIKDGRRHATPLLLALVAVELTDVVFALDSVPAVFAVTSDPFIVFTSNLFAVLGLRSLFALLAGAVGRFRFLQAGLSLVLVFVGLKMLATAVLPVPAGWSLGIIALLLGGSVAASWLRPQAG
jgi:tellurite resistance protein TerC